MLDGAPDGRLHRRFPAGSQEEAAAQARAAAGRLAALGLQPVAQRWDETSRVLVVMYAPPAAGRRRQLRAGRRAAVLGLALVLLIAGLTAVALQRPEPGGVATGPPAAPRPTPVPPAERYRGPIPHFEPSECRTEWLLGRETDCGELIVAEDRSQPAGRRISLHVAIQRSYGRRVEPDPVVYLDGGPGASPLLDGFWADPFLDERDLIVIDQRGSGLSQPSLDCPEVVLLFVRDELDTMRDCRRRLARGGIDLGAYHSAASAADLEDLRIVLGYEQWNLYGISYGSRLALTAMRDHPDGIRSVILDSVYPPQRDIYAEGARNAQRAFDMLFSSCVSDADCGQAFPDLEERFYEVVARLDERPRNVGGILGLGGTTVDGSMLINLLFYRLYMTDVLGEIPGSLDDFWNDEWDQLEYWLVDLVGFGRRLGPWSVSEGQHFSVQCTEELPFTNHRLLLREEPSVRWPLTLAFEWQPTIDICAMWDVPAADALENLAVVSDIPTLLLAGSFDPITPPGWASDAAGTLSAGQLLLVPGVGHGVLGTSFCVDDVVKQFLSAPSEHVETGCLDRLGQPEFVLPHDYDGLIDD
jgi:pimeloyl-ACP methyl ester carboxylesterase